MTTTFRAMTTEVAVIAPTLDAAGEAAIAREVAALFARIERRFSRFRADSELARLQRGEGPVPVSAAMFEALLRARGHVAATGGVFDPTIAAALCAAGYDRSFTPGALDRDEAAAPRRGPGFAAVRLDAARRTVTLPPGAALDFGGFLKGFAVDAAARLLPSPGAVEAGGDARLLGDGPDGEGWIVDVEDPADPARTVLSLRARDRAVATSAANRRRWRAGVVEQHHLIDPRSGRPAASDLAQATVLAPSAELADVLAKAAFVLGAREGAALLARFPGIGGVFVLRDGGVRLVGEVEVFDEA